RLTVPLKGLVGEAAERCHRKATVEGDGGRRQGRLETEPWLRLARLHIAVHVFVHIELVLDFRRFQVLLVAVFVLESDPDVHRKHEHTAEQYLDWDRYLEEAPRYLAQADLALEGVGQPLLATG